MIETRQEENAELRNYATQHWLNRLESALWRSHRFAEFDSWEERYYYAGVQFIISHRDKVEQEQGIGRYWFEDVEAEDMEMAHELMACGGDCPHCQQERSEQRDEKARRL